MILYYKIGITGKYHNSFSCASSVVSADISQPITIA